MVTEKGSIKAGVVLNSDVQKELLRKNFVSGLIMLILGCIGIAVYLTLSILSVFHIMEEPNIIILICVAAVFACGLMLVIITRKAAKNSNGMTSVEYEFFTDCITATDYVNGEKTASVKIYYNQIIKRKETATYLFFYINGNVALAVDKRDLTEGEINAVRMKIGLPVKSVQIVKIEAAGKSPEPVKPETQEGGEN